jgi:hypothetical protein
MITRTSTWAAAIGLAIGLTLAFGPAAAATTVLPDFGAAVFNPAAAVSNPYFPLLDEKTRIFTARDALGNPVDERFELSKVGAGPVILGVTTTSRRDRAYEGGLLVEDTFDFYAQDSSGNVWYFGEDVTNYVYDQHGKLIGTNTASSWRAGVNGALPGYIMPALPALGQSFFQEFAALDGALDQAEIDATGLRLTVGGVTFNDVVRTYETTALDAAAREYKFYAPGQGLIAAHEGLDTSRQNPQLILERVAVVPEPSTAWLLLLGLPLIARLRHAA